LSAHVAGDTARDGVGELPAPPPAGAIYAAFFLSGVAGLMHEVVWAKQLVQLIGATAHAQAVVLAVFMGGLALGSAGFGRWVDRRGRPLRAYVILETVIAAYCLALPLIVRSAAGAYVALAPHFFEAASLKTLARFALSVCVVLPPAVLMGATLPILARHLIGRVEQTQRQVARLYALNSIGAVAGAGVAGFVTLPLVGIYASLAMASLLNLAAAAIVASPARRERREEVAPPVAKSPTRASGPRPASHRVTLAALALSGFAAMGYEVVYLRIIALSFGASTYSFTVMLMSFITGIALGSALVSRLRVTRPTWWFGVSQLLVVVALLATTPLASRLPYWIALLRIHLRDAPLGFELFQLGKAGLCLLVLLLPTLCLGVGFPLVARIQTRRTREIGSRVGSTYAWNTIGNVLGVIGTSLVLLPTLGVIGAFHVNLALNGAAGLAVLWASREASAAGRLGVSAAAAGVGVVYLLAGLDWSAPITHAAGHLRLASAPNPALSPEKRARHGSASFEAWKQIYLTPDPNEELLYFEEDAHTTVAVWKFGGAIRLFVNAKADASTGEPDLTTQLLLAHAPLFLALDARSLLVIGHGSGITPGSALRHPIERADIVEISRGVINADAIFAQHNHHVLSDPRVRVYEDDGQSFLRTTPRTYDVIISEPSNPWVAGIAGLFTVEFFEAARRKLEPGGVFTLWFHQYEQSDESVELVMRSLRRVFPHVMVFEHEEFADVVAVASATPIVPDFSGMQRRYADPAVQEDLARLGITNLASLLSHHAISSRRIARGIGPGPLNRVGHQRLEYVAPRSYFLGERSRVLDRLDPLRAAPAAKTDTLLDRYIAFRAAGGDPIGAAELDAAARYARGRRSKPTPRSRAIDLRARRAASEAPR
jgi:spermidine synthase